jgi:AcrR family transcriptional regulator
MIGARPSAVAERRAARVAEIVAAAWALAREEGIAGLSLRGLARRLGIRQPSLYAYFDSKDALFDAMFAHGNRQLLERLGATELPSDPRRAVATWLRVFADFALEDVARYQLLFLRPILSFEPSAESYALAEEAMTTLVDVLRTAGIDDPGDVDCIVAMVAGLVDAQISNDPGGTRWVRHLDRLVDLYLDDAERRSST